MDLIVAITLRVMSAGRAKGVETMEYHRWARGLPTPPNTSTEGLLRDWETFGRLSGSVRRPATAKLPSAG